MAVIWDIDIPNSSRRVNGIIPTLSLPSSSSNESMSSDSEDEDKINDQLNNIAKIIALTRNNVDALNDRFAGESNPPLMYLQEYRDLTDKLHDLKLKEQTLSENLIKVREKKYGYGEAEVDSDSPTTSDQSGKRDEKLSDIRKNEFLRAYLPNKQRTTVQIKAGVTLRKALERPMQLRNITWQMCSAIAADGEYRGRAIKWDTQTIDLKCTEISVKILDRFPVATSISHNFVRKTFFSLAFCECCRRLLFQGFYCRTCGYRFHQRCFSGVPALCHQVNYNLKIYF